MRINFLVAGASVAIILAACAPKPTMVNPEPVYDKFGNAVTTEVCDATGDEQRPQTYLRRDLPRCQKLCPPGTTLDRQSVSITHATVTQPRCVPIPQDDGDDQPTTTTTVPGNQSRPITHVVN